MKNTSLERDAKNTSSDMDNVINSLIDEIEQLESQNDDLVDEVYILNNNIRDLENEIEHLKR